MPDSKAPRLLSKSKEEYGNDYSAHLFEQYRILVNSAQKISDRRTAANNYLLTVNSSLVTLFGLAASLKCPRPIFAVIPAAGLLVSIAWWILIASYRRLNSAKFDVIHEFEDLLPAAVFRYEWSIATEKHYKPLSHIEAWVPVAFSLLQIALFIFALLK